MELKKKSFKDINLKDYKKIVEINNRELDSNLEKDIAVLSVLLGVEESEVYNLSIVELRSLIEQINWVYEYDFKPTGKLVNKLKIDGIEYTVNPDINSFTVSQYMDFQNFWDKRNERMGNLLAVFVIPKGKKYNEGYDVIELADRLEEIFTLDDWNNVCFFFLKNYLTSIKASLLYSDWQMRKMQRKEKNSQKKQEIKNLRKQLHQQIRLMD